MPAPFFLFAPGAGAPSTHPWMQRWKHYLESIGEVVLFDYDYMREGKKRPDPPPQLIAAHRSALAEAREKSSRPIFLIGKSMGGRIGCHVALEEKITGLICLGYPLCGGGDRTKLRNKVLRELQTPILFVQGTRDPLCPLDLLDEVRSQMKAPNFLYLVEDGDHSLRLTKRKLQVAGEPQDSVDQGILAAVREFVASTFPPAQSAGGMRNPGETS
jgi:predicted alpha/beta-hydrolase family hydrolase